MMGPRVIWCILIRAWLPQLQFGFGLTEEYALEPSGFFEDHGGHQSGIQRVRLEIESRCPVSSMLAVNMAG